MSITHLAALKADPRVKEAKKLLNQAISDQQKNIQGIRPRNPDLIKQYELAMMRFNKQRGFDLWFPYIGASIGRGPLVELLDGSVKYDFISGIGVHHFGHSHPDIISSSIDAALSDIVMQGNLQQNSDTLELFDILLEESKLDHCFLTTSGAMANENAIKVAFQKNHPASRILAFKRNFAGRTLAMAQITEKPDVRVGLPHNIHVDYVPFFDENDPEKSTKLAVDTLKSYLFRNPGEHAAMIFELIQGEGGYYPGSTLFFKALMDILKENGVCIIVDEVQTFGRTSRLFAFQHFGLDDLIDVVTIGKLAHISATLYNDNYNPHPGLLSQTFTGSTAAIHAAKTIIHLMIREGFFGPDGKNMQVNKQFAKNFETIKNKNPGVIQGPYGLGAMVAFTPIDGQKEKVIKFCKDLFTAGVMSFICGFNPTRIRFLAPIGAIKEEDIDNVTKIVEETLLCT